MAKSVRIVLTIIAVSLLEALLQHSTEFCPVWSSRFMTHYTNLAIFTGGPALVAGLIASYWIRSRPFIVAIVVAILCYLLEIGIGWMRIWVTAGPHSTQVIPLGLGRGLKLYIVCGYQRVLTHALFTWCGLALGRLSVRRLKKRSPSQDCGAV